MLWLRSRPGIEHPLLKGTPLKISLYLLFFFFAFNLCAQQNIEIHVTDSESGAPLPGATASIKALNLGAASGSDGVIFMSGVPLGRHSVSVSFVGYPPKVFTIVVSENGVKRYEIALQSAEHELEEVVITSTRSSRTVADIPTRIEFIAGEELDEKSNMKPGDIRMLLSESTGIQTQQTSATSANASIRIQGLDGRYTQILKDGLPLYAGYAGGLGLLQIPPLDLKQVEVIKGSSSTLYGGGAIAGLVNLISKTPTEDRELRLLANGTSAKGLDLSGFFGKKFGLLGLTLFASRNSNEPYDPADIGLTAIPKFTRYNLNPRLFIEPSERTSITAGFNFVSEDRIGGDIVQIKKDGTPSPGYYYERNDSRRYSTQLSATHKTNGGVTLQLKNSFSYFDRKIAVPDYTFDGTQNSSYTELNFVKDSDNMEWIAGITFLTDKFNEHNPSNLLKRDYDQSTVGLFVQNTATLSTKFTAELGLRADYVLDYGLAILPRISILYRANSRLSSRLGGGLGYKAPTIFTEDSERLHYRNVLPLSDEASDLEKSYGANWDVNYRTSIGEVGFSVNHLFFYTNLRDPLMLAERSDGYYMFSDLAGYIDTKGTETNLKFEYGDFSLFLGYTFTDTKIHANGISHRYPLTPRHRLNNVLMYEVEERWKIGLEAYYFGKQRLNTGSYSRDYWICGFMVERLWEKISVFINFENFLDARQTRFDTIFNGTITDPVFKEIYAPVDGFVVNGGIKINL